MPLSSNEGVINYYCNLLGNIINFNGIEANCIKAYKMK